MATCYLSLGSNLGDRANYLHTAVQSLRELPGTRVEAVSGIYETAPYGYLEQGAFYNIAVRLETGLEPHELLRETQRIELENGRERTIHWGPRTLDIDLILYGTVTLCDERLTLPHPEYLKRAFVLVPLAEVLRPNDPHAAHIRAALDGMPTDGITPVMAW